jgi:quercetin dioxygenase-like cupin family protein
MRILLSNHIPPRSLNRQSTAQFSDGPNHGDQKTRLAAQRFRSGRLAVACCRHRDVGHAEQDCPHQQWNLEGHADVGLDLCRQLAEQMAGREPVTNAGPTGQSAERRRKTMEIKRNGSQPSAEGPADWFTGKVRIDPLFQAPNPARVSGASVTFEPGARTAWHTHPLGQTLIVTAGCGWVQRDGGVREEIHPGDVVWFSPGEKHWHGAGARTAMTHIAIAEALDGKVVEWMEKVSDEQYGQ